MSTIFIILGTLGSAFAVVFTILSMINYRKPRKITILSAFLSGLISLLSLAAMTVLGGMSLNLELGFPLFIVGLLLGYLRGAAVKMNWENGQVIGRNSILFIVLWGLSLALSQLLGLLGAPLLASLGLIPVVFTTGLQAGLFGHLFLRRLIMGKKEKTRKGLQIVFAIGGSLVLFLLTLFLLFQLMDTVLFSKDEILPSLSSIDQFGDDAPKVNEYQEQNDSVDSGPSPIQGQLPSSGSLVMNCAAQMEEEKEHSLVALNFGTTNYSFDEAFTDYSIQLNMGADISTGKFSFEYIKHESRRWQDFDPEQDPPEYATLIIFDDTIRGEGNLLEDDWISGEFNWTFSSGGPGEEPNIQADNNNFFGYIDDDDKNVVICLLAVFGYGEPEDSVADIEVLRTAGKDQLIPGWGTNNCYTCTIDGIQP